MKEVHTADELREKWQQLFEALEHESDFICAIVSTAFVEHLLLSLLERSFVEGTPKNEMMPSAFAHLLPRAKIAYCVGLISNGMYLNIKHIGSIRNAFAHKPGTATFADDKISKLCKELKTVRGPMIAGPPGVSPESLKEFVKKHVHTETDRGRFTTEVAAICSNLLDKVRLTIPFKKLTDEWDQKEKIELPSSRPLDG